MKERTRSLIIYGPHLFPSKLAKLLQGLSPVSSSTVAVPSAFLSFDVPGTPFLEPCYANCIVRGYNDVAPTDETEEKTSSEDTEEYKRRIWTRCSTGAEYEGHLPHPLEGMVYELGMKEFQVLHERLLAASPTVPNSLVQVDYVPFENGDPDQPVPTNSPLDDRQSNRAEIVVFNPRSNSTLAMTRHLQPTQQYLALILRGAFFTGPLTRTYLSHLFLLRPYAPNMTLSHRIVRRIVQLSLLPQFLMFWLPAKVLPLPKSWTHQWERFGQFVCCCGGGGGGGGGWGVLDRIERVYEKWTGQSGWRT